MSTSIDDMIDWPLAQLVERCAYRRKLYRDMLRLKAPDAMTNDVCRRWRDTNAALRVKIDGFMDDALEEMALLDMIKKAFVNMEREKRDAD